MGWQSSCQHHHTIGRTFPTSYQEYPGLHDQVMSIILWEGQCITSYDVKALFTSVPVNPTNSIIRHTLEQDTQLHLKTSMSIQHITML